MTKTYPQRKAQVGKMFPAWVEARQMGLVAMFGILEGTSYEEVPIIAIALSIRECGPRDEPPTAVLHLRVYFDHEGRVRCVDESVELLKALGYSEQLKKLAEAGYRLDTPFHGVPVQRTEVPEAEDPHGLFNDVVLNWLLLRNELEESEVVESVV